MALTETKSNFESEWRSKLKFEILPAKNSKLHFETLYNQSKQNKN